MKKLPKINTSKLLKAALPYILVGLMATKLGQAYRMASGGDVLDRICLLYPTPSPRNLSPSRMPCSV